MLKEAQLTKISTLLKIDAAKLKAAIADEKEVDVEIAEDLNVFTKPEIDARDKNKYDTGKKAGEGMLISALAKKHEVEAPGDDAEKFVENLTKKITKSVETTPDIRLAEKDKVLDQANKTIKELTDKTALLETEKTQLAGDSKLLTLLPKDRLDIMSNEEYLTLTKSTLKIETREGKEVVLKGGNVLTDPKTLEPITPEVAIKGYFTEKKWIKEPETTKGGRGGGNSNPGGSGGKYAKLSELNKELETEGIHIGGEVAQQRIQAALKDNPDMDIRS